MSEVTQNNEVASRSRHVILRRRCFRFAIAVVSATILSLIVIRWWKPWLNADEIRLLGVWTWQNEPGKMTIQYREDGTMRYLVRPSREGPVFTRWRLEGSQLIVEYSPRNPLDYLLQRVLTRSTFGVDPCRPCHVEFNADGTVSHLLADGSTITLIPWESELGEALKQAE